MNILHLKSKINKVHVRYEKDRGQSLQDRIRLNQLPNSISIKQIKWALGFLGLWSWSPAPWPHSVISNFEKLN